MINITVFSKDRACQLDAFLRSYRQFVKEPILTVIFNYSNDFFKSGYDKLIPRFPKVNFVKESDFKTDLLQSIKTERPLTTFFVDDVVFRRNFSWNCNEVKYFQQSHDIACLSLRLSPAINYCYTLNCSSPTPQIDNNHCWYWRSCAHDWNYPMSLDGHIFKTEDLLPLAMKLEYRSPNTFEEALAYNPLPKPKMMCLKEHVIYNIPQNKVQMDFKKNRYQKNGLSIKQLNERYLNNEIIDIDHLASVDNNSAHFGVVLKLKRESQT
jgi:hypothetical protein